MVAIDNHTSSDTVMPESPIQDTDRATLDARSALDTQEIHEALDPSDHMVDVFDARPSSSNPSAIKSADDLEDPHGDQTEHTTEQIDYTHVTSAGNPTSSDHVTAPSTTIEQPEQEEHPSQPERSDHLQHTEQQHPPTQPDCTSQPENSEQRNLSAQPPQSEKDDQLERTEQPEEPQQQARAQQSDSKEDHSAHGPLQPNNQSQLPDQPDALDHHPLKEDSKDKMGDAEAVARVQSVSAAADAVASAAASAAVSASAAALAAAGVSSNIATSTVPALHIPPGMPTAAAAYPPFAPLAPNGAPLMAHPLVSVPMPIGRRAVRIAPMGALPLPPQGAVAGAIVATEMVGGANADGGGAVEVNLGGGGGRGTIGEMPKGKRRGVTGGGTVSTEGMTAEERTKQKRMLRNRESAARSRDKRKTKNIQLEASINQYRRKRATMEQVMTELQDAVDAMEQVLKKHKIALPF